jgi:hypothetical protein
VSHRPDHPLGEPHTRSRNWSHCGEPGCYYVVCNQCRHFECTCNKSEEEVKHRNDRRLMRADPNVSARREQKRERADAALAIWGDSEVGSELQVAQPEQNEANPRPQEGPDMAAKKKEAEPEKVDGRKTVDNRREKGALEKLVLDVAEAYEAGKVTIPDDKPLTPQRVATIIGEKAGEDKPSPGAVAAIFDRWAEVGFALFTEKPKAFKRKSAAGNKQGLEALKAKARQKKLDERRAAKEAASA